MSSTNLEYALFQCGVVVIKILNYHFGIIIIVEFAIIMVRLLIVFLDWPNLSKL